MSAWRRRINWAGVYVWAALSIPAVIFWQNSVLFVIIASVYANIKTDWGAAEAADDRPIIKLLKEILALLKEVRDLLQHDKNSTH